MPQHQDHLNVDGSVRNLHGVVHLVLNVRLAGHDTFLTGTLEVAGHHVRVRILTFDDVTVLRPLQPAPHASEGSTWAGVLHLPHGARPVLIPTDLTEAATERRREVGSLDDAEMRYALTFLAEATTPAIRAARIETIVAALPTIPPSIGESQNAR